MSALGCWHQPRIMPRRIGKHLPTFRYRLGLQADAPLWRCVTVCESVSSGRLKDGYRVRGAAHREYDAVTPCWKLGAPKIGASVPPAGTEPPGALSWLSLTSPKGVEPRSAWVVRMSERLARHGLSPRGSSSEQWSS
jgi:hypothetical protein